MGNYTLLGREQPVFSLGVPGPSLKADSEWFSTGKHLAPEVAVAGVLSSYCKMEVVAATWYLDLQIQGAKCYFFPVLDLHMGKTVPCQGMCEVLLVNPYCSQGAESNFTEVC